MGSCAPSRKESPEQGASETTAPAPERPEISVPTGPRSALIKDWSGTTRLPPGTSLLVMAGHADAQNLKSGAGAGTAGAAVDLNRANPMYPGMTDELYWALEVAKKVATLGAAERLNIRFYDPPSRSIENADDPRTCWSMGKAHVADGGYAFEIHFDAYGKDGIGSGLIPSIPRQTNLDEALAAEFGPYPKLFRDGLGGPRRGISLIEIGKLEGPLEAALRNSNQQEQTINGLAVRVIRAIQAGFKN